VYCTCAAGHRHGDSPERYDERPVCNPTSTSAAHLPPHIRNRVKQQTARKLLNVTAATRTLVKRHGP
jgi:hypothetical protein